MRQHPFTDDELVDLRCRVLGGTPLDEATALALIDELRDVGGCTMKDLDAHCDGCVCDDEDVGGEDTCDICCATGCHRIGHDHSDHLEYDEGALVRAADYDEARECAKQWDRVIPHGYVHTVVES